MGVQVRILGPVAARIDGQAAALGPQLRRLLAILAVNEGTVVPADFIAESLWPDGRRNNGPNAVRTYVARLRQGLGDETGSLIQTQAPGYLLQLGEADGLDSRVFDEAVAQARSEDPAVRVQRLDEALAQWSGPALAEFSDEQWALTEAVRLEELRLNAWEDRYDAALDCGMYLDAVPGLEQLVRDNPLRDRLCGQLMLALYRAGRQAEALRRFQVHRAELAEAGLEPSSELTDLERGIAANDARLKKTDAARRFRGYRVSDRLGEGAFSVVWRGVQPSLGREVAIKQIRAELANRPEFIRRFEAEAHLVARLEHPFIVPLYDYWREPDSAYLVFRALRGGSLASALLDGPWSLDRTSRLVEQVGSALTAAHRAGVVHRDVKPENILLDDDGNSYLTDFGIALGAAELDDPDSALSAGSPAYASPEQLLRQRVGPAADIHGLGIVVYETLTGRLPFPDARAQADLLEHQLYDAIPLIGTQRPDLPPGIDDVVQRATAKGPSERYSDVHAFVEDFIALRGGPTPKTPNRVGTATVIGSGSNPYKALAAFDEADTAEFFGRDRLVDQLTERLDSTRIVTVVGPSGSGKSSVARAGLLPALRAGAIPTSERWFVTSMLPGKHPFEELETALLRVAVNPPASLVQQLSDDERGIARAVRRILPDDGVELLLVIDQFEELFTLCEDVEEQRRFLAGLRAAVTDDRSRLRVITTIRADFYDRPLRYQEIASLVRDGTVIVTPLAPDELEAAIVEPARRAGAEFEPGLVSRIVADVADQPGALPMLQYALTELYERRVSGLLTLDAYGDIGGVSGSLATRAEELYHRAEPDEQNAIRRLFSRLVNLGEGAEDTRRRVLRSELQRIPDGVISLYGTARLLSFDRDPVTREPTIEVAHEALIREWPRFRTWLDEDRDGIRVLRRLHDSAETWEAGGRDVGELYRGGPLDAAVEWSSRQKDTLNPLEQEFLAESAARRAAEEERERRGRRRLGTLLGSIAVALVAAIAAGLIAETQRRRADEEARRAGLGELRAEAARLAQSGDDPDLGMLLAAEAHARDDDHESLGTLQRVLTRTDCLLGHLVGEGGYSTNGLHFSEGRLIARSRTRVEVWEPSTRDLVDSYEVGLGSDLEVTTDSVFTTGDGDLVQIAIAAGAPVARFDSTADVTAVGTAPGRDSLVVGHSDGRVEVWSGPSWRDRRQLGRTPRPVTHIDVSPDGRQVAVLHSGARLLIWDVETAELVHPSPLVAADPGDDFGDFFDVRWLDDERVVASLGSLMVFDTTTLGVTHDVPARLASALAVIDSTRVIQGSEVFDVETAEVVRTLDSGDGQATAAASQGGLIALASERAISLFSTDGTQLLGRAVPRGDANGGFIDSTGTRMIALRWPLQDFTIWDTVTGANLGRQFEQKPAPPVMATFTPNGGLMTFSWAGSRSRFWDEESLEPLGPPVVGGWLSVAISPDRDLAALASPSGPILVYDVGSGERIASLHELADAQAAAGLGRGANEVRFSWDGSLLVGSGGVAGVWDTRSWEFRALLSPAEGEPGFATVGMSRAGDLLAVGDADGRITLFDTETWADASGPVVGGPPGPSPVFGSHGMRFSEDDSYIVFANSRGAQLFDVAQRTFIGGIFPNDLDTLMNMNPSPDGRQVVAATKEHLIAWNLEPDSWFDIACRAAGRSLTRDEWDQFIGSDPYDPAC